MVAVPERDRTCAGGAGMCHEWTLTADPAIRFVAYGFEDGIDYSFFRRSESGMYRHLVRIHPLLRDASRPDSLFWGYPWDVEDLALAPSGDLLVTFGHDVLDDGVVAEWPGQRRTPAVLFVGRTTQPQFSHPLLDFAPASLPALRADAQE